MERNEFYAALHQNRCDVNHGLFDKAHKYIAKIPLPGKSKWRYFYNKEEYQSYLTKGKTDRQRESFGSRFTNMRNNAGQSFDRFKTNTANAFASATNSLKKLPGTAFKKGTAFVGNVGNAAVSGTLKTVNKGYTKVLKAYNTTIDKNIYATNNSNYATKTAKIAATDEWRKLQASGNKEYANMDDYLAKKKHPVLDLIDDVVNGRELSVNRITKDSLIAGANDYLQTVGVYAALASKVALTGVKFKQGTYRNEVEQVTKYGSELMNNGASTVANAKATAANAKKTAQTIKNYSDAANMVADTREAVRSLKKSDGSINMPSVYKLVGVASSAVSSNPELAGEAMDALKTLYSPSELKDILGEDLYSKLK